MALGADDRQTAGGLHLVRQLDVGSSSGHVRRDGDLRPLAGFGHDLGLLLVLLGVQYVMLDSA